jgi:hypothetical protein
LKWSQKWSQIPLNELGIIGEWIEEARSTAYADAVERGRQEAACRFIEIIFDAKFGGVPVALAERIATADSEWCGRLMERALEVESLEELEY